MRLSTIALYASLALTTACASQPATAPPQTPRYTPERPPVYAPVQSPTYVSPSSTEQGKPAQQNYEQLLRQAKSITISERVINIGKDYDILVGGQLVATVSGKDFKVWGDTFTLKTMDGKVLASETEEVRILSWNRGATVRNGKGDITGYLGEETFDNLFSMGYLFHFYDPKNQEVGKSQKIGRSAISFHRIYDAQGNPDYAIDKKFTLIGDEFEITVADASNVPLEQAILLICIEDAIADSEQEKEDDDDE